MYCKCYWRPPLLFTLGSISSKPQNPLSGEAGTSTNIFCDSCGFLCLLGSCFLSRGLCAHSCNPYVKLLQFPHTHAHSHTRPPAHSIVNTFSSILPWDPIHPPCSVILYGTGSLWRILPLRDMWPRLYLWLSQLGQCSWHLLGKGQVCGKHPTLHGQHPITKNDWA